MGLLDRNKRKAAPAAPLGPLPAELPAASAAPDASPPASDAESDSLRDMLIAAVSARDSKLLTSLVAGNRRVILERFGDWQRVPEAIRNNGGIMQRYAAALIAVAEFFRDRLDDTTLIQKLTPPTRSIEGVRGQWEEALGRCDAMMREGNFDGAAELLGQVQRALADVPTDTPIPFHGVTCSRLAQALFAKGDIKGADEQMQQALRLSAVRGDANGIAASLRGMYEICRYAGRFVEAADFADRIAAEHERAGSQTDASWWKKQGALVRAGEPLCRVVFFANDRQYELDEPPANADASLRYGFVRNRPPIQLADMKVQQGMQLAAQGKFVDAMNEFQSAMKIDPYDPTAHFQSALALMHLKKFAEAVAAYDQTERLAPGWMNTRAARWVAAEIAAGRIDPTIFLFMLTEELPDESVTWEQKLALVEQAMERAGELAPLLHYKGRCLTRLDRGPEAEAALRAALAKTNEPDLRTRVLVDLQLLLADGEEKRKMLEEAAALNGNLIAAAVARIELFSFAARRREEKPVSAG